jgi:aminopeptidase N
VTRHRLDLFAFALALALLGPAAGADTAPAEPASSPAPTTTQLPRGVRPLHYDVSVVPDAAARRFAAMVAIEIEVGEATDRITLNAIDLDFGTVGLQPLPSGPLLEPSRIDVDARAQTASFVFARPIAVGSYRLQIAYRGPIGDQAVGFFALDYGSPSGRKRALYTQFENSDARRFMPSWDEPAYKATFALETTLPAGQMAISNMPVAATTPGPAGTQRVRFAATPPMSTYLLFLAVGEFERATASAGATEVGVVTRAGAVAQASFALASAQALLAEYNDYFDQPYPLPKLDNVAAPGSNPFYGAMENWGAIFSFEPVLLLDPQLSSEGDRQRVFGIAAHEIAHQWFGNLVTMRWWNDLWLNEGFASWLGNRTTQKLHPEWNLAPTRIASRNRAIGLDAFATTHAVVQPIDSVDQANQAFDAITYAKGAAVIGMIERYVGADTWRAGVRRYIKANAYRNTVSDDLWREIEAAAGRPILAIARDFTLQPGVPLVRVERSACADGRTTLDLVQEEFSIDRPDKMPQRWRVPVIARAAGEAPESVLVENGKARLVVPGCGAVVVNAGQSGYFRTLYTGEQKAALRDSFATLDPIDQLGLIDDAWAFGMAGQQPMADALELVAQTPPTADATTWQGVAERLQAFDSFYRGTAARQAAWRAWAMARLRPVLARIGWQAKDDEGAAVAVLRAELIQTLGHLGDSATIDEARRRYAARTSAPHGYPVALRRSILSVVARQADAATWQALRASAVAEKNPLVRARLYQLLASVRDEALARRALELALSDEPGPTQSAEMVSAIAEAHPDLTFDYVVARRDRMDALLDATARSRFYPKLALESIDPAMVGKLQAYADRHIAPEARRPAESAMAQVRMRSAFARDRLATVDRWLATQAR